MWVGISRALGRVSPGNEAYMKLLWHLRAICALISGRSSRNRSADVVHLGLRDCGWGAGSVYTNICGYCAAIQLIDVAER